MKLHFFLAYWKIILDVMAFLSASVYGWIRIRQAHSWPSVQGTVWEAKAREMDEGSRFRKRWAAEMTYSYVVEGEYFSGYHTIRTWSEKRADEKTTGWKGRMLVVRHHPSKPEVSVLLRSDQPGGQLGN